MDKLLVTVKLKHEPLDEIKNFNYVLVVINGFIFPINPQFSEETLSTLSMKDCKCTL